MRHFTCISMGLVFGGGGVRPCVIPDWTGYISIKNSFPKAALQSSQHVNIITYNYVPYGVPVNIQYLYNIYTMLDQRRRRWIRHWIDVLQMFCGYWGRPILNQTDSTQNQDQNKKSTFRTFAGIHICIWSNLFLIIHRKMWLAAAMQTSEWLKVRMNEWGLGYLSAHKL